MSDDGFTPTPNLDPEVEATIGRDLRAARKASTHATGATRRTAAVITEANSTIAALRARRDDHFADKVRATIIGGRQAS